ncbi:glycosyltransferase [Bacteroides fragilis]|uniref:glycosyltransferase family 2 protein n=2 Tax=Bacteroides fragilis TaxID=817 RepID=UPI00044C93B1|nr:glycosyltransferase [Bacteroides fragilis]EYA47694.1 glycosyl transferase 2 family protein [Bacteroides fragilis str. 3719 T6]MCE9186620.1 glycosyltransferase [Bacteroides fragilis]
MKISVIIPVYNAEKSISYIVETLLSQTFKDFEILLINDGSTDNTAIICNQYAAKYSDSNNSHHPIIRVFHKMNGGVAMARQLGVDNACGEYSIHADADDWVEPTMLEEMYNKAKAEEADVVIADYFINKSAPSSATQGIIKKQKPSSINANQVLMDILESRIFGALWNKMVRTELYQKYNARFFFGINYCEDVLIWAQILKHEEVKVSYLGKAYYHYFINVDSITHKINRKSYSMRRAFKDKLDSILIDNKYNKVKRISSLGIFAEGFMNKCLTKEEIKREFKKNEYTAFHDVKSLRWRLGYLMIKIGCYPIAHKLIRY